MPAGGGGSRMPTWKERENNKRRERRRRAIAANIFAGLRMYGNYKLPKHCDNNEVLKALCDEAGWTVEIDGTTYRKGCNPPDRMDIVGGSVTASPCSTYNPSPNASYNPSPNASYNPSPNASYNPSPNASYNPSPFASYNTSPASSSFLSPRASFGIDNNNANENSLIPWLKNLSSTSSLASSSKHTHFHMYGTGSISAPVTPPLSSPTSRTPRIQTNWNDHSALAGSEWLNGFRIPQSGPTSPTFTLVSSNPFGFKDEVKTGGGSRMWTPGQSGTCSPVVADVPMAEIVTDEFAFGSNASKLVKPWEGERIHEECGCDDLELTLGIAKTR